jgi:ATP-dependent DNA helicase RecG
VRSELEGGRQAYIIYPLVEHSDKVDLKAATEMADHLAQDVFPVFRVGLLHGRMKTEAKDRVMKAFVRHELDILVATTVIEVGVDVPNASVIIVEHAERFGLSQLHQIRGRVGRGPHPSSCFLLYQSPLSEDARARLKAMSETTDGFELAEKDLQLRGPGDLFGTRQAGVPTFRLVDLVRDRELVDLARREAEAWLANALPAPSALEHLLEDWRSRFHLIEVG